MKNVDRLRTRRDVKDAVGSGDANSDFSDAWSNRRHRLPVVRIQSLLDAPQLETSQPPRKDRKLPKVTTRVAEQDERLVRHRSGPASIQVLVCLVQPSQNAALFGRLQI